jgi:cellulose synthase/poly-beta-1,6-N-acetylglucosamine synthase-like glycosyltransferase
MTAPARTPTRTRGARGGVHVLPVVDVAVPVYDEENDLERSVRRLDGFLENDFPWPARITIVDNASRDRTWEIARRLDTELLVLAQREGMRVHEVAVDWVDDPDSRVDIVATALADLRGIARIRRRGPAATATEPASEPELLHRDHLREAEAG